MSASPRRRTWRVLVLSTLLSILVLGALGSYRAAYGNWPWQGVPARLQWCDRVYYPGETSRSREEVGGPLHPAFRAPPLIGRRVFARHAERQTRRWRQEGEVCGLSLFVRSGDGRYTGYDLSGGP